MIRHYDHLHDEEAKRRMNQLDFLGNAGGRSTSGPEDNTNVGDASQRPENNGERDKPAD